MSELADFLLARLDEDEAAAQTSREHAECAAKRLIVEDYRAADHAHRDGWDIRSPRDYPLRALALVYVGHPDYRQEWRP